VSARALAAERLPGIGPVVTVAGATVGAAVALAATRNPLAALVVMAAIGLVLVSAVRPQYALLILVAVGPLEGQLQSDTTTTFSATKLAGALAFGSFTANAIVTRRKIFGDLNHFVVIALLAVAMLSMTQAQDTPIATTTTLRYASFVFLFFVVSQSVGDHKLQRLIAWTLVISAAVAAVLALDNFVAGHENVATLKGTQEDDMGFMLATTLPYAFWLIGERGALRRGVAVVAVGILSTGLVLSFARGAMLAVAVGFVWQLVVERRHIRLLVIGALAAGLAALFVVQSNQSRVSSGITLKQQIAAQNVSTRLQAWDAAANLAADHPLLGIGPGNFRDVYYQVTGRPPGSEPRLAVVHNAYLDIAAELGVVAFLLFMAYLGLAFTRLGNAVQASLGPPGFASIVRTSLVVACVGALTLSEQYFMQFWLFGGLASALWAERLLRKEEPAVEAPAVVVEPVVRNVHDPAVTDRREEERKRRTRAQFEAIQAQQARLDRRLSDLQRREEEADRRLAGVEQAESAHAEIVTVLSDRQRELAEREAALRQLEQEAEARRETLAAESERLVGRRRRVAARETELAAIAKRFETTEQELEARQRELRGRLAELATQRRAIEAAAAEVADRERAVRSREAEVAAAAAELARRQQSDAP
jgi:putative inorganic carbon (hco3(-)) transporter